MQVKISIKKKNVFVGCVLHERSIPELKRALKKIPRKIPRYIQKENSLPKVDPFVENEIWEHVRRKKTIACADVVVGGWRQDKFLIASFLRGPRESYPNTYCMFGGNLPGSITSIEVFLKTKVEKEMGVQISKISKFHYLGTYITRCPKTGISTLQACYFTEVEASILDTFFMVSKAKESKESKLFSREEWQKADPKKKFWFQDRTFNLVWDVIER